MEMNKEKPVKELMGAFTAHDHPNSDRSGCTARTNHGS